MQHLVANWHVDRNRAAEWEQLWNAISDIAQAAPGFQTSRLMRSVEHPGKYTVYSVWESRDLWDLYFNDSKVQELVHATFRLLKGPPIQEWFDLVREEHPAT